MGEGKKNGHIAKEEDAADAKPERKKSDVVKPTKEEDPKPASETKQPVPTTRKGSTGGPGTKTVPNTPGTAAKTVPNTPASAAKTAGSAKEQDKKSDGFYGFPKRA